MNIKKFFEFFQPECTIEDVIDIFNDISDEHDVDIEFYTNATDPFFPSYPNKYDSFSLLLKKNPKISRYEAISKIIELKTGELLSPKFIESYMSDYYGYTYTTITQELKDYHKQFADSKRYPDDIKMIKKYEYSKTYLIFINFKYSEMEFVNFDFDPIFQRLKSMYDLDKLYFNKNNFLGDNNLITTIMVV